MEFWALSKTQKKQQGGTRIDKIKNNHFSYDEKK